MLLFSRDHSINALLMVYVFTIENNLMFFFKRPVCPFPFPLAPALAATNVTRVPFKTTLNVRKSLNVHCLVHVDYVLTVTAR